MQLTRTCEPSLQLRTSLVEKPWGRTKLPPPFGSTNGCRIGEIWFEHPGPSDLPLLAKYIFTTEKLSVQVHPDDEQARARGLDRGKSECWYILDTEPDAVIGAGLIRPASPGEIRAAALDGSIEKLIDWRPVLPGDFIYVPAGTIHAIGAGISMLEFQQNSDVTYRLYDYGRPRELHLDDGVAVSNPAFRWEKNFRETGGPADCVLMDGPHFSLVRASPNGRVADLLSDRLRWVMPLQGSVTADGLAASAGECMLAEAGTSLSLSNSALVLIGAEGSL